MSGGNGSTSSTTRPVSTGAILSFNLLNTDTQAYVSYTNPLPHPTSPDVAAASGVTVSAQDMATITATIVLGATMSGGGSSGSQAIAGAVSFNQVSGGASASVGNAAVQLTGGALLVSATEAATITANTQSEVTASSSNGQQSGGSSGGSSSYRRRQIARSQRHPRGERRAGGCDCHRDRQHHHRHDRQRPERDGHG